MNDGMKSLGQFFVLVAALCWPFDLPAFSDVWDEAFFVAQRPDKTPDHPILLPGYRDYLDGDYQRAISRYSREIEAADKHGSFTAEALFFRAEAHWAESDGTSALRDLDRALALRPDYLAAYLLRGIVRSQTNFHEAALGDFSTVLKRAPNRADIWLMRSQVNRMLGNTHKALDDAERCIGLEPGNSRAHFIKGNVLRDMGKSKAARMEYDEAIRLNPAFDAAYALRAIMYLWEKNPDAALVDMDSAVRINPSRPRYYAQRAFVYALLRQSLNADRDIEKALSLSQSGALVRFFTARAQHVSGKATLALKNYNAAIEVAPGFTVAYCARGLLHKKMRRIGKARADLDSGIREGGQHFPLCRKLKKALRQ